MEDQMGGKPVNPTDPDPCLPAARLPIRTTRLTLRPCETGDGGPLADAVAESWATLHPWFHDGMGSWAVETDPAWQERVAQRFRAQFQAGERLPFLAWDRAGTLIGFAEIIPNWCPAGLALSYWVRQSRHRQGYGSESVTALARTAFGALQAKRVTAHCAAPNHASIALITKLGFEPIARTPLGQTMPDKTRVDTLVFALSDPAKLPAINVS